MKTFTKEHAFNCVDEVVHRRVDCVDQCCAVKNLFLPEDFIYNSVLLLIVSVLHFSYAPECIRDGVLKVLHVVGLKLPESELNHGKGVHF